MTDKQSSSNGPELNRYSIDLATLTPGQRQVWDKYFAEKVRTEGNVWLATIPELLDFNDVFMLEGGGPFPRYPPEVEHTLRESARLRAEYLRNLRSASERKRDSHK